MIPQHLTLDYILTASRRRLWYIVIPFFLIFMATVVYCIVGPKSYVSTAVILVQPQEVPKDYIKPTVTTDMQGRLSSITEQVMSRSKLEEVITKYDLYPDIRANWGTHAAVEKMREHVSIKVKDVKDDNKKRRGNEEPSAFEISFEDRDRSRVRDITADIVNLFIDYNFKLRAEQAAGTLRFLDRELERMREELRQKEELVRQFKEKHLGLLPEQMENNSRILTQLQQHLDSVNKSVQQVEDRRVLLQTQSRRLGILQSEATGPDGKEVMPSTAEGMRQQLKELQARYSDNHPDVIRLKALIARAEKDEQSTAQEPSDGSRDGKRGTDAQRLIRVQNDDLSAQLKQMEKEIVALQQEKAKTQAEIQEYRRRIESGPKVEQMFLDLRRDYQRAADSYQSLLQKRLEAELAENMERTQKGEQFKILDPANVPDKPTKPNILKLLGVGFMVAIGSGVGVGFLLECRDPAFWSKKDLESTLELPVLVSVPVIRTKQDDALKKRRMVVTLSILLFMVSALAVSLFILWKTNPGILMPS